MYGERGRVKETKNMNEVDKEYLRLLRVILENGRTKHNRTGVDTVGVFGEQAKFKVSFDEFPILTTKKIYFRAIVHELLWFIKGDTNIKYLVDNDVHIWDEWAYARYKRGWGVNADVREYSTGELISHPITQDEFIQRIKKDVEFSQKWGELGKGTYGGMWRHFPHFRKTYASPPNKCGVGDEYEPDDVDQIAKVIDKLKTNPDDRRMIVSAWHPYWVDHCALPPCHCLFHFNTEELTWQERLEFAQNNDSKNENMYYKYSDENFDKAGIPRRRLNCLLYQRSCDTFLGVPFNITSYSLLLAMVAHCVGMEPGVFTHTYGDLHIYRNHEEQVNLQLSREPMKLPKLLINPNIKDLFALTYNDIKLIDYVSHPSIKGEVAV